MRRVPPGRHILVARDPSASAGGESSLGSIDELPPATSHGYAEWDFSGVPDPVMFRRFLDVVYYWFGYSDDSSAGSYNPTWECCVVIQELPAVVWSLRTTPSRATGFTPFFLVHGAEAVLPKDLEYGSARVQGYDEEANQRASEDSLDQLDEARLVALMHSARYQQSLRRYQARMVRRRDFSEWDLVLRLRQDNRGRHKL
jgi:hypothetical protein